jgi:hypothetical protein
LQAKAGRVAAKKQDKEARRTAKKAAEREGRLEARAKQADEKEREVRAIAEVNAALASRQTSLKRATGGAASPPRPPNKPAGRPRTAEESAAREAQAIRDYNEALRAKGAGMSGSRRLLDGRPVPRMPLLPPPSLPHPSIPHPSPLPPSPLAPPSHAPRPAPLPPSPLAPRPPGAAHVREVQRRARPAAPATHRRRGRRRRSVNMSVNETVYYFCRSPTQHSLI